MLICRMFVYILGVDLSSEAVMAIEALFLLVNSGTKNKQGSVSVLKV